VKKAGAWFTYEGEQLGQGRENVKSFLAENLDLVFEISEKVRQAVGIGEPVEGTDDNDEKVVDLAAADEPVEG
jgi:recombination protein RecA